MHFTSIVVLSSMLGAALADCNHDNCLRAVIASAFPTRASSADCSSYLKITVTPATATFTTTNTHTTYTATVDNPITPNRRVRNRGANKIIEARQATVSPTNIPSYASACSGAARYSSACSCIGITASTTTAPTPSTTITVQATVSAIRQAPGVLLNNYLDEACSQPNTNSLQESIYADGTCFLIDESNSNINIQFTPGNCAVTAAQCTLTLFPTTDCSGAPLQSFPASNSACFDTFPIYSANLVCPAC